jgi:putative exporter of polyketide antibiotics
MTTKARMGSRGQSSVFTAVIMTLAIIAIIAAVAISWPMIKTNLDKNSWAGSMSLYKLNFGAKDGEIYAYAQNGVSAVVNSTPGTVGYCFIYNGGDYIYYSCPSNTPSYQG